MLLAPSPQATPSLGAQERPAPTGTRLDFRDAPLADVIRSLASAMGLTAVTSAVPAEARLTFSSAAPVATDELAGLLEGILESNGLVAVVRGSVAQVYPSDKAPKRTGAQRLTSRPVAAGLNTSWSPLQGIHTTRGRRCGRRARASIEAVPRSNSCSSPIAAPTRATSTCCAD
jgi:general secretion pathway protein D